ncbi:MAG: DUF2283 domain-containing protein [Saprospiraceae bacterium]|nr:DUF2283 domain-containing protein [Saprospiraceae bacterium]
MKVKYDKETDILYIQLNELKIAETDERNGVILDFASTGELIGIEVLDASKSNLSPLKVEYEVA